MNVRELVTVLKFKTDSASLKSAENAVNRIKTIVQRTKPLNLKVNTGNAQKSVNALTSKLNQLQQNKRVRINVDTSQIDKATQSLNRLSQAQVRASQAHFKGKSQGLAQGKTQSKNTAQAGGMGIVGGLKGAFVALGGMAIVSEIKQTADAMMSLSSRIKLVTKDETERLRVERALYDMSNRNRASLEDVGDLYYKTALSAKQFGISQEDLLRMTDIVTKSLTIGGADTAQQKATILQLSQALGSGVLQGDELRSLRENAPKLMTQIAQYFGKTVAELKQMGAKGELTTDQLVKAILASGQTIDQEFGRITPTIGQAITVLGNKWSKFILDIQNNTGFFGQIAGLILDAIDLVGKGIDWVVKEFGTATPEMMAMLEDFKNLWQSIQPITKAFATIITDLIVPALKVFGRIAMAVLGMVAQLLQPIADLLGRIAGLVASASSFMGDLINKASSGSIEKYNSLVVNQNNNVNVGSASEAGEYVADAMPMEFAQPD
ncbi:MAG: tape measure protein [Aeriscardovia sp.]|nr:tape measure protein [Aeriscardovia sp.]